MQWEKRPLCVFFFFFIPLGRREVEGIGEEVKNFLIYFWLDEAASSSWDKVWKATNGFPKSSSNSLVLSRNPYLVELEFWPEVICWD